MSEWTFFSNHGHVLVCLARDREARLRDVALQVGITERAVQKIVRDMQDEGYLEITKHGRRNRYRINNRKALRHPLQSGCTVGQLLKLLGSQAPDRPAVDDKPKIDVKPATDKAPAVAPVEKAAEPVVSPPVAPAAPAPAPVQSPVAAEPTADDGSRDTQAEKPEKSETASKKPSGKDLEQGQLF